MIEDLERILHNNMQTDLQILDFQKAFERCSTSEIVAKTETISNQIFLSIESFQHWKLQSSYFKWLWFIIYIT